jgi:hypothetical protein
MIMFAKANLSFVGKKAVSTTRITLQNTIPMRTIKPFTPLIAQWLPQLF